MGYKFKAWQPYEGYQTIAINDDYEAIMWGLEHQVDIFTQEDKLVYSPNDDEESNFERLAKYGVRCIDDANGRRWERIGRTSTRILHELKTLPEYFGPVFEGIKTFEIRKDDRNYNVGDLLHLKEFDGESYVGKSVIMEITYSTAFNQVPGYLVLAIKEPSFDVLNSAFGYNKAACLTMGCEPIWVLEQASDEDLEANISAVDSSDVM